MMFRTMYETLEYLQFLRFPKELSVLLHNDISKNERCL